MEWRGDLNEKNRGSHSIDRGEEREQKAGSNERGKSRCQGCEDSRQNYHTSADDQSPLAALPVTDPGEQRAYHLTDLEDGKHEASGGSFIFVDIVELLVLGQHID